MSSGLASLDVVLRECAPSLPNVVVRIIRMYAGAPLVLKLRHAQLNHADAARLDALVKTHHTDLKLYALEHRLATWRPEIYPLNDAELYRVNAVVVYAAQVGSVCVVKWALGMSPNVDTSRVLRAACALGNLAMVQAVRKRRSWYVVSDSVLLRLAASAGHVDVFEWIATHQRNAVPLSFRSSATAAARHGHITILEWIAAKHGSKELPPSLLQDAAVHGQQGVLEWIRASDMPVTAAEAAAAMDAAVKANQYDALEWLHTAYPQVALSAVTLRAMVADAAQCDIAASLVKRFPERYAHYDCPPTTRSSTSAPKDERRWRRVVAALRSAGKQALRSSEPAGEQANNAA